MSKKNLSQQEEELPYWPSKAFIDQSLKLLRENGIEDSDELMTKAIHKAYWKKRAEILADMEMEKYEKS